MRKVLALIAALGFLCPVVAGAATYPNGAPFTAPVVMPADYGSGTQAVSASCASSNPLSCPAGSYVGLVLVGVTNVSVQITGASSASFIFETSLDCTNFQPFSITQQGQTSSGSTFTTNGATNAIFSGQVLAQQCFQVRATSYTSGTAQVTIHVSGAGGGSVASSSGGGGVVTQPTASQLNATVVQPTASNFQSTATQGSAATLPNAWPFYFGPGGIPTNANVSTVTATVCTNLSTSALAWGVALTNANSSAQTVTITLYNDSATGCAVANQRYQIQLGGGQTFVIPLPKSAWTSGLAYVFSGTPAANVLVSWL